MIFWKDFIFDEVLGPILGNEGSAPGSEASGPNGQGIRNDAQNQETSRSSVPARMVGTHAQQTTFIGMDADLAEPSLIPRVEG